MEILEILAIIGSIMGYSEWRFRVLHSCSKRIEGKFDQHVKDTQPILERFFKLEERVGKRKRK